VADAVVRLPWSFKATRRAATDLCAPSTVSAGLPSQSALNAIVREMCVISREGPPGSGVGFTAARVGRPCTPSSTGRSDEASGSITDDHAQSNSNVQAVPEGQTTEVSKRLDCEPDWQAGPGALLHGCPSAINTSCYSFPGLRAARVWILLPSQG